MRSQLDRQSFTTRYGAAALSLLAALLVRVGLRPLLGARNPYTTVFLAVLIVARYWGAGPSLFVAVAGGAAATLLIASPDHAFAPSVDGVGLGFFLLACCFAIWVIELLRRARDRADQSARIADERLAELQRHSEERDRQQKLSALLTAVVESSDDAIISKNLDGVIQSWNRGAEEIFGYTSEEAVGKEITLIIPPDRLEEETGIIERIRAGGRVKHFETVRARKNGTQIQVALTISPISDPSGVVVGASQIARDITEQKQLEEHLRQTQKLESLGVLAGGLAHDFNNLLTGIVGNASLAALDPGDQHAVEARIQEILSASDRAALLVRQMLAYCGKGQFVVETLDLSSQVKEIVTLLRPSISRLVEIDLRLDPALPKVNADRSQLQQVIMNLAINGAEAIGDRPGVVTITTSSRDCDGQPHVVMEITDTGCGMDEHTKARIFDPFFTTKFTGRGLGLAAVMGIIHGHRGSISVESEPGRGSRFSVIFPAATALLPAAKLEPTVEERGQGNILVVDDEDLVRTMAKFTLERCGYTVELAQDGRDAIDAFSVRPNDFAAVLLDLTMPVMSGEEALRLIRQIRPNIPIVLSSGFSETEALERFKKTGLACFLQKPYTASALARRIKQAVTQA